MTSSVMRARAHVNLNVIQLLAFCSSYDEYGFVRGADFDAASHEEFMSSYLPVLVRRGQRWQAAYSAAAGGGGGLGGTSVTGGEERSARLKRFVRKGIPNRRELCATLLIPQKFIRLVQAHNRKRNSRWILMGIHLELAH